MRTLKLTIAYDGTRYAGWQIQRGSRQPTIQRTLERVFRTMLRETVRVVGSGRTDAGVHALGQVAHLRMRSAIPCERLLRSCEALLPDDIAVLDIREARPEFHARFSAVSKRYRYTLGLGIIPPFERRYVQPAPRGVPLKVSLMRREAGVLLGRHDFLAFHHRGRLVSDTVRTITAVSVRRRGAHLCLEVEGSGFLYAMVRGIVGTLLDIGRGHRPSGTMAKILRTRDRRLVGPTAPAKGLCLMGVRYRGRG